MARIRTIKPSFFRHESLFDAERETGLPLRVAYAGLWTACDREGRFVWAPRQLKLDCLPHDDVDFDDILNGLAASGFIVKYTDGAGVYGYIPSWKDHQVINQREAQSILPAPPETHMRARASMCEVVHTPNGINVPGPLRETIHARDGRKCLRCGSGDDLTIDHIFPQSIGGTHAISNLRTLCRSCNSSRPVAGDGLIEDLKRDGLTLADMPRMCVHVRARGEGKGREGKDIDAVPPVVPPGGIIRSGELLDFEKSVNGRPAARTDEADLFERGKSVLGPTAGGLIKNLLKAKNGNIALARSAIELASTKQDPREYIGAIIRGRDSPEDLRARGEAW